MIIHYINDIEEGIQFESIYTIYKDEEKIICDYGTIEETFKHIKKEINGNTSN